MSDDPNQKWTSEEAALMRSLRDEPVPPAGLEDRIVRVLKQRGRIRAQGGPIIMIARASGLIAAAAAVFIAGFAMGGRGGAEPVAEPAEEPVAVQTTESDATVAAAGRKEFMLLMFMRADAARAERDVSPEAMAAIVDEYRQWAMDRQAEHRLVAAEKLADVTRVMTESDGTIDIEDSAHSDRVLGGYFRIIAGSLDEAIQLARTHPHLKYGGEVEVRPIEFTGR